MSVTSLHGYCQPYVSVSLPHEQLVLGVWIWFQSENESCCYSALSLLNLTVTSSAKTQKFNSMLNFLIIIIAM